MPWAVRPAFISNKMSRDSFTAADLIKIAEVLDCTLSFTLQTARKSA